MSGFFKYEVRTRKYEKAGERASEIGEPDYIRLLFSTVIAEPSARKTDLGTA